MCFNRNVFLPASRDGETVMENCANVCTMSLFRNSLRPKVSVAAEPNCAGDERMEWVAADMQGWRQDMEDEHIASSNVGEEWLAPAHELILEYQLQSDMSGTDSQGLPAVASIASLMAMVTHLRIRQKSSKALGLVATGSPRAGCSKPCMWQHAAMQLNRCWGRCAKLTLYAVVLVEEMMMVVLPTS